MINFQTTQSAPAQSSEHDKKLFEAAQKLEAGFLAEMLKSSGLGQSNSEFSGGVGEEQFSSFLLERHAMQIVRSGGIGLTESLFRSLKAQGNE